MQWGVIIASVMTRLLACLLSLTLAITPTHALDLNLPDLGDVAAAELSPRTERRLGESIMQEIRWQDPSYIDDAEIEEYVNQLGGRLVAASSHPDGRFEFFVMRDPMINAFALPGGYIGLHSGLILMAESESELASVLGHEIAHVTQRHIAQLFGRHGQTSMVMLASLLLAALAGAAGGGQMGEAALAAGQAGAIQSQLNYSRAFEREADRVGLQLLDRAGFDPRGMPGFFARMQRTNRLYESAAPGYLRTHPMTNERFTDMESRVAQMRYRQVLDSPEFGYVRAKLRATAVSPSDAVRRFEAAVNDHPDDAAQRYGLARALLRAGRLDEADAQLARVRGQAQPSSFIEMLDAEIAFARRDAGQAADILAAARQTYPGNRAVRVAHIGAVLESGQVQEAARLARQGLESDRRDLRMWQALARAEERLGRRTAYHRAQAEVYALRGSLPAAIDQLERARQAADGDFYDMSAVDARLRELKDEDRFRREEGLPRH